MEGHEALQTHSDDARMDDDDIPRWAQLKAFFSIFFESIFTEQPNEQDLSV